MGKRSREASASPARRDSSDQVDDKPRSSASPSRDRFTKVSVIEESEDQDKTRVVSMQCSLPPHRQAIEFFSCEEYEIHYVKEHTNRCTACGKNFPTARFLNIHQDENHNPFRETLQEQGEKTFACFVEGCDKLCSTPQKRRLHLIDKHAFPKVGGFLCHAILG